MTDRELMQQALEALESNPDAMVDCGDGHWEFKRDLAITALRAAIEQAREWQGLTDDEREQFRRWAHPDMIEAIELRLQERNT